MFTTPVSMVFLESGPRTRFNANRNGTDKMFGHLFGKKLLLNQVAWLVDSIKQGIYV